MKKFSNLETTLVSKWFNNRIDEIVDENSHLSDTDLICLLSVKVEEMICEDVSLLTEGYVSELIGESFKNINYADLIKYYKN